VLIFACIQRSRGRICVFGAITLTGVVIGCWCGDGRSGGRDLGRVETRSAGLRRKILERWIKVLDLRLCYALLGRWWPGCLERVMSLRWSGIITHVSSSGGTVFVAAQSFKFNARIYIGFHSRFYNASLYTLDNDKGHRWMFDFVDVELAPCVPFQLFSFQSFKSTSPLISLTPGAIPSPTLKSCAPVLVRLYEN